MYIVKRQTPTKRGNNGWRLADGMALRRILNKTGIPQLLNAHNIVLLYARIGFLLLLLEVACNTKLRT